jgi:hypothetical protein
VKNTHKSKLDKKKSNENSKYWKNKLWALVRKIVLERDGHCCVMCGNTEKTNVHHIIDRRYKPFSFETNNLISLCPKCHKFDSFKSVHCNPARFLKFLKTFRKEQWKWINEHCNEPFEEKQETILEIYNRLNEST